MDALCAPIGGPPAEGSVRLRLPSPTKKQSTGLFFLPLLRFALLGISLPAGSDEGSAPRPCRPFEKGRAESFYVFGRAIQIVF